MTLVVAMLVSLAVSVTAQPQARFDDVVRNLRNPDQKIRLNAVRLLREARYPEAIAPMAPLVNDPVDQIQLEAIAAELSFFLAEDIPERRRIGGIIEVRNRGGAPAAFDLGPLAVMPRVVPAALITSLLKAVDDENPRVRLQAIYALGTIARSPLPADAEQALVTVLDHYDPPIREAAARVIGRLTITTAGDQLIKAMNDSSPEVRFAAMRALGEVGERRAIQALGEQLKFYGKGEGAWSALTGLALMADKSLIPVFTERVTDKDQYIRRAAVEGLGRAGDPSAASTVEHLATTDSSSTVRAAAFFALHKFGRSAVPQLVDVMRDEKVVPQVQQYLLEIGPTAEKDLLARLQDAAPHMRAAVADVLGAIGGDASLAALQGLQDREKSVVEAATRAVERIKLRRG